MNPEHKPPFTFRLWPIAVALVLLALGFWLYSFFHRPNPSEEVTVARGEIIHAVYATGTVEPVYWAMLSPQKTGRLVEILHYEGDAVAKGEVVARMEDRVVKERLHEAQVSLHFQTKEAARYRALAKTGAASRARAEDAEQAYGEAKARVQALQRELGDLTLAAPMKGVVLRRDVELGETIQAGESAFWVGSPKPLRITAEVDEEDIGKVKLGQAALIKADAFPEQVFEGKVNEITPQGDPVNKVFRVRVALPDNTPLMINMTVEANIVTRRTADALLIPSDSEEDGFVWRIARGKKKKTPVKIGIRNDTQVQVLEGLNEGDRILRTPPARK